MSVAPSLTVAGRTIGGNAPSYVIAELSANHNQSFQRAVELVRAAKASGADAVKLQTYTADTLTFDSDAEYFRISSGTLWDGTTLHELYSRAHTPWEWQPKLKEIANDLGLPLFSTPFDATAVDFLEEMGVPAYKIASFEIIDLPLIRKVAATERPLILSTGMATLAEIDDAVRTARASGCRELALLKCTSAYPSPPEEMHLATIPHLGSAFDAVPGLSDHTLGIAVPVAAVALGARVIEKHLTLSRSEPGPDSAFSLEPGEFRAMVDSVRVAESAIGDVTFALTAKEEASAAFRRSLFVVAEIRAGEAFSEANVRSIRPGHGLPPKSLELVLTRRAARDIHAGTPLTWDLVS